MLAFLVRKLWSCLLIMMSLRRRSINPRSANCHATGAAAATSHHILFASRYLVYHMVFALSVRST